MEIESTKARIATMQNGLYEYATLKNFAIPKLDVDDIEITEQTWPIVALAAETLLFDLIGENSDYARLLLAMEDFAIQEAAENILRVESGRRTTKAEQLATAALMHLAEIPNDWTGSVDTALRAEILVKVARPLDILHEALTRSLPGEWKARSISIAH